MTRGLEASGAAGLVTSPSDAATRAGVAVLNKGGTAIDAAIATNAVLGVTLPHMCGVGGDLFGLVDPGDGGAPIGLNASGPAGREVNADRLHARGGVPARSLEAVTVPGALDGWRLLHERFGRLPWSRLLTPAIALAADGVPMTERTREWFIQEREALRRDPASAATHLDRGSVPATGSAMRQPELAHTLEVLATAGPRAMYEGPLGRRIASLTSSVPDGLKRADLAAYHARFVPVAQAHVAGRTYTTLPPNSQGATLLLMLRALYAGGSQQVGPAWYRDFLSAKADAFQIRDEVLTQPEWLDAPIDDNDLERLQTPSPTVAGAGTHLDGDTIALATCDREGRTCVLIQSLYFSFGSAITVPGTGILLQNRGAYFATSPGAPNRIAPGRRTLHTLMPVLVYGEDGLEAATGTMGGDGQPQVLAQVLAHALQSGATPGEAVAAPRLLHGRFVVGEPNDVVHVEDTMEPDVMATVQASGHPVQIHRWPSQRMGHACIIACRPGELVAAADPRSDGAALAAA